MRKRIANWLALTIGVIVVLVAIVFSIIQQN